MRNVVTVKIHRNAAGRVIPYDKLYFFRYEDRHLIPKVFPYAMVLPADEDLLSNIASLQPHYIDKLHMKRNDADRHVEVQLETTRDKKKKIADWWKENVYEEYDFNSRVAVVPILARVAKHRILPVYMASKRWFTGTPQKPQRRKHVAARNVQPLEKGVRAFSELAYLSTPLAAPNDKIRPLCSICPRMMLHIQGECVPGQAVCYRSLDFSKADDTADATQVTDAGI